jgi:hypothetical protein
MAILDNQDHLEWKDELASQDRWDHQAQSQSPDLVCLDRKVTVDIQEYVVSPAHQDLMACLVYLE